MSTPSFTNAQQVRDFVSTTHDKPYAAIDPTDVELPEGYVVCIIGAGGASGSGLARSFVKAGASGVILAARTERSLEATVKEIVSINSSINIVSVPCDISSNDDVARIAAAVNDQFDGRLDAVFVNCGFSGPLSKATILEEEFGDVQKAFSTHCLGTWLAAHHLLPFLLTSKGSFIAISSISAQSTIGFGTTSHYCASKLAQARMIEILHAQYSDRGIFVASVHPGGMQSEFSRAASKDIQHLLNDSPDLVGAFCVWMLKPQGFEARKDVLNGRWLSCKWDVDELQKKFENIQKRDLLKFRMAVD
ncbi:short-chain alcohol dehydrogenases/reductase SDR family member 7 precursor [Fusarium heterosporum]|uniref:Short-chain alcohol dehydrogenases/reductase SDR family member 7 n=1 Tax=Fusarium heterosporum TaxID=42747 RepID=A0A8H5TCK3_FUSHE|nr:short-chain alcohol dehydrogenases/reductase SDR family member 7 precursor [Fusarium heterosporum]